MRPDPVTFPSPVWRVLLRTAAALAVFGAVATAPAGAAEVQTVDLNADGIPDRIQIENTGSSSTVRLMLSGHRLIVFRAKEPIISIRATDLDRDGDLDLVAMSTAHHLWTWRNAGHGKFRPVRKGLRRLLAVRRLHPNWQPPADPAPTLRDELGSATPIWNESLAKSTTLGADTAPAISSQPVPPRASSLGVSPRAPPSRSS